LTEWLRKFRASSITHYPIFRASWGYLRRTVVISLDIRGRRPGPVKVMGWIVYLLNFSSRVGRILMRY
jgi:hypothetical protein